MSNHVNYTTILTPPGGIILAYAHCRGQEDEDQGADWDFHLTVREAEPPKRPTIMEPSQKPTEVTQPLKETGQNEVSAAPGAALGGHVEEGREVMAGKSNRLSNGLDPHQAAAAPVAPTVVTNHSPRSSALQETRLSTLSTDSNPGPLLNGLPMEQELASTGEQSSMEQVVDESAVRNRHRIVQSVTEETRELDDYLNRSSVTSVLTESQIFGIEASAHAEGFERIGGGSSEEDLEGGASSLEVRS